MCSWEFIFVFFPNSNGPLSVVPYYTEKWETMPTKQLGHMHVYSHARQRACRQTCQKWNVCRFAGFVASKMEGESPGKLFFLSWFGNWNRYIYVYRVSINDWIMGNALYSSCPPFHKTILHAVYSAPYAIHLARILTPETENHEPHFK
jgi:hypothetical protein